MKSNSDAATRTAATIRLTSSNPTLEISVTDGKFREVARGHGGLDTTVDPGIYELRYQAGPAVEQRLITLRPGQLLQESLQVLFPAAAPIEGSSTSDEYQMEAGHRASAQVASIAGGGAGLVLMLRNLRGQDDAPVDRPRVDSLMLFDSHLQPVPGFAERWEIDTAQGWATWAGKLDPGGYALRASRLHVTSRGVKRELVTDQSLWLSAGWQSLVFIPNQSSGAATDALSVHMAPAGAAWHPQMEPRAAQALELALWGLREGRNRVPPDLLQLLLQTKFVNPMLGIVAAHCMLLDTKVDLDLFSIVTKNLAHLTPGNPDVRAVSLLAADAGLQLPPAEPTASAELVWPPMLMRSFSAFLRRDAVDPGVIPESSTAERVASRLIQGLWTTWRPLGQPRRRVNAPEPASAGSGPQRAPSQRDPTVSPPDSSRAKAARPGSIGLGAARDYITKSIRRAEQALPLPGRHERQVSLLAEMLRRPGFDDSGTARLAAYLSELATTQEATSLEELMSGAKPSDLSIATGLPSSVVRRGLSEIGATLEREKL